MMSMTAASPSICNQRGGLVIWLTAFSKRSLALVVHRAKLAGWSRLKHLLRRGMLAHVPLARQPESVGAVVPEAVLVQGAGHSFFSAFKPPT